jgi:hypothetical protein
VKGEDVVLAFEKFCDRDTLAAEIAAVGLDRVISVIVDDLRDLPTVVTLPYNATNEEVQLVTKIVAAHSDLFAVKFRLTSVLREECRAYIHSHYDQARQASLTILMVEGLALGYPERLAYLGKALDWIKSVIGYYYEVKDSIDAQDSAEGVEAISWDMAGKFDQTDPLVTIREAVQIVT